MAPAVIYIVRHGETNANKGGIMQGQLDTILNSNGLAQAELVANALQNVKFDMAFCSDLSRAVKTAEVIIQYHPTVQLQKVEALRERVREKPHRYLLDLHSSRQQHMGDLQGLIYTPEAMTMHKDTIEKTPDFQGRAIQWWNALLQQLASLPAQEQPHNVLVVSHGGWIQTLVHTLEGSRKLTVAKGVSMGMGCLNVSITVIETDGGRKGKLIRYGDVSHLIAKAVASNVDELP
ncbi:hypothetical protein HWV62_39629 [Athelia sp. TMB]|nr:hypothetical protein HWV62_39629 [Athelia sp. TMB]